MGMKRDGIPKAMGGSMGENISGNSGQKKF
jgi:hypothetical protein